MFVLFGAFFSSSSSSTIPSSTLSFSQKPTSHSFSTSNTSFFHPTVLGASVMLFSRVIPRRTVLARLSRAGHKPPRRTMISAPGPNTGPLMERRADRELPTINTGRRWLRTLPIFVVAVGAAMLGIFNYQKSSSSVVSSTLYALRTSPRAREILGDEIYFAQQIPWISGEMNQLHGRIDISFWVKGTKGKGKMRFRSIRPNRTGFVSSPGLSLIQWKAPSIPCPRVACISFQNNQLD